MIIEHLELANFKNYQHAELSFSDKVNCFLGPNGAGKSNLLDALYYLSFCKSYFNPLDSQNIRKNEVFFRISGRYRKNGKTPDDLQVLMQKNQRKQVKKHNKEYERLTDHIGLYPMVIITPSDVDLIHEGSGARRKFIDGIISQFDKTYLDHLMSYNKAVQQRNALLKRLAEAGSRDPASIDVWDRKMIDLAPEIYRRRREFLDQFIPVFEKYYRFIAGSDEKAGLHYESQLSHQPMEDLLKKNFDKDYVLKYTSTGVHKDDFIFSINESSLKKFGSQGQKKSFIIAAKLAQFEKIRDIKGFKPIILLDDIFDKLDEHRVHQMMVLVSENNFGQIFLTDTDKERVESIFSNIGTDTRLFDIKNGEITGVHS